MSKNIEYTVDESTGCWNCTSHAKDKDGYIRCIRGTYKRLHRYMYAQRYGDITSDIIIRHTCDNPSCINPEHLLAGNVNDNINDRMIRNRSAIGVRNGRTKLTELQVLEIYHSNSTICELSKKYNIHAKSIYDIKRKKNWKYLLNTLH